MAYDFNKLLKDSEFFIALVENSVTNIKTIKINNCIDNGADVNIKFANNANNTPLHIAVLRGDKEVVNILLCYGAKANVKNDDGKTALDVAKELPDRTDIAELLQAHEKPVPERAATLVAKNASATKYKYNKRPGTANVRGQLYETKLLTLIYLRAYRHKHLRQFYLGTNVDDIGDIDDVCLRFKTVRDDYLLFLQAKHKQNIEKGKIKIEDLLNTSGDFSLLKYFDSYIQIRHKFSLKSDNVLFDGTFRAIKCYYVIYTTVKNAIDISLQKPVIINEITDLIATGDHKNIFQLNCHDQFINLLTKAILIQRLRNMGIKLFNLIHDNKWDMLLIDKNIQSFHVVLAQKVINVSEVNIAGCRTGSFREEFLSCNEELLTVLRDTLYREVIKINKLSIEEIDTAISNIYKHPDAETISELIGSILTYDNNTNTLILKDEKRFTNRSLLTHLQVPQSVANEAFEIAGRRKLSSLIFNLPVAFGNLDITLNQNKADRRLKHLAKTISDYIKESADVDGNVVIPEEIHRNKTPTTGLSVKKGGIADAIGNLLVSDDTSRNRLKFNLHAEKLPENAKKLLLKLQDNVKDLHRYRFITYGEEFPRLSMHATEHEQTIVMDFLDNLYFYTAQAQEDQLEKIETEKLQAHECFDGFSYAESSIRSNALFLKVHNEIQIWWMTEKSVEYLTKDKYEYIFRDMMSKGLLTFLNIIYVNEIHKVGLEFNSDALKILSVCEQNANMVVFHSDVHILTTHKLARHLKLADCMFLDIDYICRMSPNCIEIIKDEVRKTNIKKVVIICEDTTKYTDVIRACGTKQIILVTSNYAPTEDCVCVKDDKINLTDLTDASQHKVLQTQFTYQGTEVTFAEVIDEDTKYLVNSKVLEKIINKEHVTLGQTLVQSMYEETKHYYIPRTLQCTDSYYEEKFSPLTLIDHRDVFKDKLKQQMYDVVLILDAPGMGKSTLLTHLSLETKRRYPKIWIQRINLIDHTKQFYEWHEKNMEVDRVEALKFMCKIVLSKEWYGANVRSTYKNNVNLQIDNEEIKLIDCEDISALMIFELKMFLHCFKKGRIIFLFDGFDEICPHYKREVMQLLKHFGRCNQAEVCEEKPSEQCVWITSRPYNELKDILENEFGESYTLQPFFYKDIRRFVDMYMRRHLNINALTKYQLKNINGLFEYMYTNYMELPNTNNVLKSVYVAAIEYFENEIKHFIVTDDSLSYVKNWDKIAVNCGTRRFSWEDSMVGMKEVPLHVYIAAHNFQNQVKDTTLTDTDDLIKQWDLETSTFTFYERFIETKLKTIRFEEKAQVNTCIPDMKLTYDKEKKEFLDNHKKLAFYSAGDKTMFTSNELDDVREIIRKMELAEEKTGFVDRIVDGEPRFVHYTFAEYFAVEYIVDCLKSSEQQKQIRMLDCILNRMIFESANDVLQVFELKVKYDFVLANAICTYHASYFIFQTLRDENKENDPNLCAPKDSCEGLEDCVSDSEDKAKSIDHSDYENENKYKSVGQSVNESTEDYNSFNYSKTLDDDKKHEHLNHELKENYEYIDHFTHKPNDECENFRNIAYEINNGIVYKFDKSAGESQDDYSELADVQESMDGYEITEHCFDELKDEYESLSDHAPCSDNNDNNILDTIINRDMIHFAVVLMEAVVGISDETNIEDIIPIFTTNTLSWLIENEKKTLVQQFIDCVKKCDHSDRYDDLLRYVQSMASLEPKFTAKELVDAFRRM